MKPLITVDELRRLMPLLTLAQAGAFVPELAAAMAECEIGSKRRRAAFLAQLAHESKQLTRWVENLNYSANRLLQVFPKYFKDLATAMRYAHNPEAIANRVYANRMGNGNEASGDGWRFRARGPIGLTGRANYRRFGDLLEVDLEGDPDLAKQSDLGFRIAALFWKVGGLNELADKLRFDGSVKEANQFAQITKRINGGTNGQVDRLNYYRVAKQALHADEVVQETTAPGESPATVSTDTDAGLLGAAVKSEKAKAAGMSLGARVTKHVLAALSGFEALSQAQKFGAIAVLVVVVAIVAWVAYHNRKRIKALVLEVLK
jgi:putative chitinase